MSDQPNPLPEVEKGIEKMVSIANKGIADGLPAPMMLAALETNLITISRANAMAMDILKKRMETAQRERDEAVNRLRGALSRCSCHWNGPSECGECADVRAFLASIDGAL